MPASSRSETLRRALPVAGLVIGAWALLPPYSGPALATETRVEVADHVVPGVVVLAVSVAAVLVSRRAKGGGALFGAGLIVILAGIWMVATHVPLAAQGSRGEPPGEPLPTTAFPAWPWWCWVRCGPLPTGTRRRRLQEKRHR